MPEYLAPGVYVEEVSFRTRSIEGVSTTTTGFIGPTRYGPTDLVPELLTSLGDFERIYGDGQQLAFGTPSVPMHNYVWHAVRAFFEEGGQRLYVVRAYHDAATVDGIARAQIPATGPDVVQVAARFPGVLGNMRVRLTLSVGQNLLTTILVATPTGPTPTIVLPGLQPFDVVVKISQGSTNEYYVARQEHDPTTFALTWAFYAAGGTAPALNISGLAAGDQVRVVTLGVTVFPANPFDTTSVWSNLALDPAHTVPGPTSLGDSFVAVFAARPPNRALAYRLPISMSPTGALNDGVQILNALIKGAPDTNFGANLTADSAPATRSYDIVLLGGLDGDRPLSEHYEGTDDPTTTHKTGLKAFEDLDDVSIIAAPGSTHNLDTDYPNGLTVANLLIDHATRMRYRIAVLDAGDGESLSQVRALRAKLDSTYAALYYPWVRILDPITRVEIDLPPSGFVAGIYSRNDITRAVYKAPANEVVNLAIGFGAMLNKAQQDVLNPEGINCFRFFEGRGYRLWGARTVSSDPEWKYVNLRRYFAYLEHSIDRGTQWVVFEPNGEQLWASVRRTIENFLFNEWQSGALLGDKPEQAFFVRCDRSTMSQNDLDNGRLVCQVGVVALRPAEFVVFRIGQATADAMRRAS